MYVNVIANLNAEFVILACCCISHSHALQSDSQLLILSNVGVSGYSGELYPCFDWPSAKQHSALKTPLVR